MQRHQPRQEQAAEQLAEDAHRQQEGPPAAGRPTAIADWRSAVEREPHVERVADGSRPVSFIEGGQMLPPLGNGPFVDLMTGQASSIERIATSVGRIDSDVRIAETWMSGVFYAGSAFVVGSDLAMTNRHVAEIMIRGDKSGAGPFRSTDPGG